MLSLFDTIYSDDNYEDIRPRYLGACTQLNCFAIENPKIVENVIGKINAHLYEPEKQIQGLGILQSVLTQCSADVFTKNSITWLTLITRILQKDGSTEKKRMALVIAKRLLLHLSAFPELRKQITEMSQSLILSILKSSKEVEKESMECLAECLKLLPGPCGIVKSQIEQHIWSQLTELHLGVKEDLCTCFAFLPTCGGSGNQNATYIMNWQSQMSRVLSTLHIILNHVFEGIEVDGQNYSTSKNSYDLPEVPDNLYSAPFKYSHYFDAISLCLVKMLSTEYYFKVRIPVEEILSLVYRILAVNNRLILSRPSTKMSALGAVLPSFYSTAVTILRSLILSCQKLLLPYSDGILKSLIRTLQQTSDGNSSFVGASKPYSFLRSVIYDTLSILLLKIRMGTIMEQYVGTLVEQILLDIKPERVITKLQHSTVKGSKGKHRKRNNLHTTTTATITGTSNYVKDLAANYLLCKLALKSLKALLHTTGSFMKPNIYKELHATCIMLILEIQQNPLGSPVPYNKHCCRQEIYSVLLACLLNPPSDQLLPIQTAFNIFSIGQKDPHIKVAEFCTMALSVCSSIIHPQVSVIQRRNFASRPETAASYSISSLPAKSATNYFDQSNIIGHNQENSRTMLNFLSQDGSLRANGEINVQDAMMPTMIIADKPDDICYKEVQQSEDHRELNGFSILPAVGSPCRENTNPCERDPTVFLDGNTCERDTAVFAEGNALERDASVFVEGNVLERDSTVFIDGNTVERDTTVFVEGNTVERDTTVFVEGNTVVRDSNVFVDGNTVETDTTIFVEGNTVERDTIISVEGNTMERDTTVFVEGNTMERDATISVEGNTVERDITVFVEGNTMERDAIVSVEGNAMESGTTVFVEGNTMERDATISVEGNTMERDTTVFVEGNTMERDATISVEGNTMERDITVFVEGNTTERDTTVFVERDDTVFVDGSVSERDTMVLVEQSALTKDTTTFVEGDTRDTTVLEEDTTAFADGNACEKDTTICIDGSTSERDSTVFMDVPQLPNDCDEVLHGESVLPTINCTKETDPSIEVDCIERCSKVNERKRPLPESELEEEHPSKKAAESVVQDSEEQLGVEEMLQDFVPDSPDKE